MSDVGELSQIHARKHCRLKISPLNGSERKPQGLVTPIGSDPAQDPGKARALQGRILRKLKRLASGHHRSPIAPQVHEERRVGMPGEAALRMALTDLARNELGTDGVACKKVCNRNLAPRCHAAPSTMLVFGLAENISFTTARLKITKELAGPLAFEIPEPRNRLVRLAGKPVPLRKTHRAMVPTGLLLALVPRGPMHRMSQVGAGDKIGSSRMVLAGAVDVRRRDRKPVDLASKQHVAKAAQELRAL